MVNAIFIKAKLAGHVFRMEEQQSVKRIHIAKPEGRQENRKA
jgi:hypothetical protein